MIVIVRTKKKRRDDDKTKGPFYFPVLAVHSRNATLFTFEALNEIFKKPALCGRVGLCARLLFSWCVFQKENWRRDQLTKHAKEKQSPFFTLGGMRALWDAQ